MLELVTTLVLAGVVSGDEITWRVVDEALVLSALPILDGLQVREPSAGVAAPYKL